MELILASTCTYSRVNTDICMREHEMCLKIVQNLQGFKEYVEAYKNKTHVSVNLFFFSFFSVLIFELVQF